MVVLVKRLFLPTLISVLALVGVCLLLYPSTAAWFSQYNQSKLVGEYAHKLESVRPDRQAQLDAATAYNKALVSGAELKSGARIASGTGAARGTWSYNDILRADDSGTMGRVRIRKIDVDMPIYHGTSEATLLKGAGHLEGTSLPVGGASTRTVITAHRGLASARLFTDLDKLRKGDTFTLEVFGRVLTYRVFEVQVVAPSETRAIEPVPGKDLATLVTCTPLGINSHRILVTGERVIPTPKDDLAHAGGPSELPRFPWWALIFGGTVCAVGAFLTREVRAARKACGNA
ncbi:sortase family protein [Winkia neuii]|uniref:class C sortase n=1 Tax=Winkia neuii TaxID=33007 RepID=UPI0007979989|nr:sortase family protein [Winkia neuii]